MNIVFDRDQETNVGKIDCLVNNLVRRGQNTELGLP